MDAATLQRRIYSGYSKAAKRIGFLTDVYRPATATNALATTNKQFSLFASFNAEDMKYGKPNKYGHPTWYALIDGSQTKVGDYLTNDNDGTFFIAAQQQALPILVVQCNRTVDIVRPQKQTGVGVGSYGGNTNSTETALMTAWPCSILQGTKGDKGGVNLPGDVRDPWWVILLPAFPGIVLRGGDIIKDDLKRRYVVSSPELTDLGWRITAAQEQT